MVRHSILNRYARKSGGEGERLIEGRWSGEEQTSGVRVGASPGFRETKLI